MKLSEQITNLKNEGKTHNEIASILNCAKSTVSYYLNPNTKNKSQKRQQLRKFKIHPYQRKIERFRNRKQLLFESKMDKSTWLKIINNKIRNFSTTQRHPHMYHKPEFTLQDVLNKFGENPVCYLTGETLNIYDTKSYQFDHIIPVSRGGTNSIDNLGICSKQANQVKNDMTPDELYNICKLILENKGYKVVQAGNAPTS